MAFNAFTGILLSSSLLMSERFEIESSLICNCRTFIGNWLQQICSINERIVDGPTVNWIIDDTSRAHLAPWIELIIRNKCTRNGTVVPPIKRWMINNWNVDVMRSNWGNPWQSPHRSGDASQFLFPPEKTAPRDTFSSRQKHHPQFNFPPIARMKPS